MLLVDVLDIYGGELNSLINELRTYLKGDLPVPLFIYTKLEDFGIEINNLIQQLEKEING